MIRCACRDDAAKVVALLQYAQDELGHSSGLTIDPATAEHSLVQFSRNPTVFFYVMEDGGEIVGAAIGMAVSPWCTKDKVASDMLFYCLPKYRGRGVLLIKRFISWAQGFDAVRQIVLTNATDDPRISRLYQRLGFILKGGLFIKECPR